MLKQIYDTRTEDKIMYLKADKVLTTARYDGDRHRGQERSPRDRHDHRSDAPAPGPVYPATTRWK